MGAKINIDIVSKTFIITEAPILVNGEYVLDFDIKIDLYSDAKEDWQADSTLRVRAFPLTAVGGNPTVGSNKLGSTYFIADDWKIQLYAADHRFRVNGNFYSTDGTSPFLLPLGNSVLLEQQVSNLVDSTVQQLQEIEFSTFQNSVWVDVTSNQTGTTYPSGNSEYPVNNIPDAVLIANQRGFRVIQVIGNITLGTGDDVRGFELIGTSHVNSTLIVEPGCLCLDTLFTSFDITGTLDGNSEIRDCIVRNIEYFNGHIHSSLLAGRITLSGALAANIEGCKMFDILEVPILDCGGSGQDVVMTNYSGRLTISNLTGDSNLGIGCDAGDIYIDDTCTSGIIAISGSGGVEDNSPDTCYVINKIIDGTKIENLQTTVEFLRPHHTGIGTIWYWDPYGGNDNWDGQHRNRAFKTFARAHDMAGNATHDIIICVSGNPNGLTIATEFINITKDYLFLRGPGRDFNIVAPDDTADTITITGRGAEVSGLRVSTTLNSTHRAIYSIGDFTLIKYVYIFESHNGIEFKDSEYSIADSIKSHHGSGFGVKVSGTADHIDIIDCHIGGNGSDGIIIDTLGGHEVNIKGSTIIHKNAGYGINISATSEGVIIDSEVEVFSNTLGDINDSGIDTYRSILTRAIDIANSVWNKVIP